MRAAAEGDDQSSPIGVREIEEANAIIGEETDKCATSSA